VLAILFQGISIPFLVVAGLEWVEAVSPGVGEEVASLVEDVVGGDLVSGEVEVAVEDGGGLALDLDGDSHMGHILMLCHHMGDTIR
jgi:thiamine monophosphate kinase